MEEKHFEKKTESGWNPKQYMAIAAVVFATFCCCTLFFFMIYRYNGFASFWGKLFSILQPIIIGFVLAYLLNPVMNFFERHIKRGLQGKFKSEEKEKKISRAAAIVCALAVFVGIITLLLVAIVPSISNSIQELVADLPQEINNLILWANEFIKGDTQIAAFAREGIQKATEFIESFFTGSALKQMQTYLVSITSGVISGVKFVVNILVGLIVSVYVMYSKETFAGQAKKILYAVFKPVRANVIIRTVHKSNEIFGGFISGKILDSAIIGVLAYIVLSIMDMPDTVLVSVIIGVTNIIPFFGPIIGAIPSFFIIVLQNPMQSLYFLIFVLILQQLDGNVIGPKILGDSTGLSSFWVIFAIMVFGGLWGFLGMLLGVPFMAVIYYIVKNVVEYILHKRQLPVHTENYVDMVSVDRETNHLVYAEKPVEKARERKMRGQWPKKKGRR